MPKNKEHIVNGTKYHLSIAAGDEVTTLVYGLHHGTKCKVIGDAPISWGYFRRLVVQTDTGIKFFIDQNLLLYWEDYISINKSI